MPVCTYRLGGHVIEQTHSKIMEGGKNERVGKGVRRHEA